LYSVPNAGHGRTIEDRPKGTPDAERRAIDNGKRDVVGSTDATRHADKACRNGVSKLALRQQFPWGADTVMLTQTQIHDCHHERPSTMFAEDIIHVLMLKESAAKD
jgi:hypothetical protein